MTKINQYTIGISFRPMNEVENFTADLTVNPINKNKKYNKTFKIPDTNIREITKKLGELRDYIKKENIQSVTIESPNFKDNPMMYKIVREQIIMALNECDIPVIVYGEGDNIEKPEYNLSTEELKIYKDYLERHSEPNSSFEEESAWTNDSILTYLEKHSNDLGRIVQIMCLYQYAYKGNGMGTAYPKCNEYLLEHVEFTLKQCNIKAK